MYSRRPVARRRAVRRAFPTTGGRPFGALVEVLPAYAPMALWVATGAIVTLLGLRFAMRLIGVRGDVPLPGAIYAITSPLVAPFYGPFPASDRFDYPAIEVAALVAAGMVIGVAVVIYAVGLVIYALRERGRADNHC